MDTQRTPKFFLELTEQSEIDTVWFVSFPNENRDYMAAVYRDGPDQPWQGMFRFRHPDDEKSGGYVRPAPDTDLDEFRARLVSTFDLTYLAAPTTEDHKWRVEVKGDATALIEKTHGLPWMNVVGAEGPLFAMTHEWPTKES